MYVYLACVIETSYGPLECECQSDEEAMDMLLAAERQGFAARLVREWREEPHSFVELLQLMKA